MGYCSSVLRFGSPSLTKFQGQKAPGAENKKPEQDAHFVKLQAASPRTSPVASYSSKTPSLGERLCAWVKTSCNELNSARLKFGYENACRDALLAVDLAVRGGTGSFSKAQLLHYKKCRGRQVEYLKSQLPDVAKKLDHAYHVQLKALVKERNSELQKMSGAMKLQGFRSKNGVTSNEFVQAGTICNLLLKLP